MMLMYMNAAERKEEVHKAGIDCKNYSTTWGELRVNAVQHLFYLPCYTQLRITERTMSTLTDLHLQLLEDLVKMSVNTYAEVCGLVSLCFSIRVLFFFYICHRCVEMLRMHFCLVWITISFLDVCCCLRYSLTLLIAQKLPMNNLRCVCDIVKTRDEVAEWLRRWTANPLCSARVGSNPTLVVLWIFLFLFFLNSRELYTSF